MDAAAILRLIAEPSRQAILGRLRQGPAYVSDLVVASGQQQSNVSHHLATLREAGLVVRRRRGRNQEYRLADPEIGRLLDQIDAWALRLERTGYSLTIGLAPDAAFHGYG